MKPDEALDHLLDLVKFYKGKMEEGSLTGAEGNIYLRALMLLGLRDATIRSRHIEAISQSNDIYANLPFQVNE